MEGIAVLLHQGDVSVLVQGQDGHTAGVLHHFPAGHAAVGQAGLVHLQLDDDTLKDGLALYRMFRQIHRTVLPYLAPPKRRSFHGMMAYFLL